MYDIEQIGTMDIAELWSHLQILLTEPDQPEPLKHKYKKELDEIKEGNQLRVPIWYFTQEWHELYPSSKKAKIYGHGKYPINEFMEEKERREVLLRNILIAEYDDGTTTTPR